MLAQLSARIYAGAQKLAQTQFLRNALRYSTGSVFAQVLLMIYTFLVARVLGPTQFGVFSASYALAGLSIFVVNWGMDTWLLREPKSLAAPQTWTGRVLQIKLLSGLAWGAVLVLAAPLIRSDTFTPLLMFVAALDVWCDSAINTHIAGLNIQNRVKAISRLMIFFRAFRLASALAFMASGTTSPLIFAFGRLASTLLGLMVAAYLLKPVLFAPDRPPALPILRASLPFGLSEFLALIYMQADVTLLTILTGSALVGLYSPSTGITNAFFLIPSSIFMISIPLLSRQFTADPAQLPRQITRLTLGFLCLGLGLALVMAVAGNWFVRVILGPEYLVTSVLVLFLSPLLILKSLEYGWAAVLVSVGWQKQRLLPQVISAVMNVLVNLWAIPRLGLPGVAAAYIASELVLALGYFLLVLGWTREMRRVAHQEQYD
jgi:O-antigen/teichoic acid export membrane protein